MLYIFGRYRNSLLRGSRKTDLLANLAKFAGKHLCQGLFSNKVERGALQLY